MGLTGPINTAQVWNPFPMERMCDAEPSVEIGGFSGIENGFSFGLLPNSVHLDLTDRTTRSHRSYAADEVKLKGLCWKKMKTLGEHLITIC